MSQPALTEPLRRWDPERIGGYALVGRLGAGAMGRVYLGTSASGRLVAIKTIKIELADEPDFRTRFAQEVAAARRVSGAFTAAVVAADPEADVPWLATAYVPAPALSRLVRSCGPLPVAAVRWLGAGCAEALESIHGTGLVHRDLKPSNVLVSPDGPRVIDFGVARAAERIQLTATRGAVGTPAYMAPEQARDTRQATMASDVFSLGATLLFAATGHGPYQGETVMDVLVRLATEPPDLTGLPDGLADIVVACLQRDPRRRPSPAAVLAGLAPGVSAEDPDRRFGPSSLPGPALALIAGYRRDPMPSDQASAENDEEATFGSQSAIADPGSAARPGGRRWPAARRSRPGRPRGPAVGAVRRGRPGRRRILLGACAVAAVTALAGAGAIGFAIAGAHHQQQSQQPPPPPGGALGPPPQGPQLSARQGGGPKVAFYQNFGDGFTVFVLYGVGWRPGRSVTVALAGLRASPVHPVVDRAGTFSYAINQDHEFFRGGLPAGTYHAVVTVAGAKAEASFVVDAPPGR